MKPHPVLVNILTRVEEIIPKWKIVPTKDVIDSAFKDSIKREEVMSFFLFFIRISILYGSYYLTLSNWINGLIIIYGHFTLLQIRNNKLIYQDKPRLKTALEMLRTSMSLEDSLNKVIIYVNDELMRKNLRQQEHSSNIYVSMTGLTN